jgi:two-component system cell cycle sensor histidine kinase/response regulator CckA
MRFPFLFDLPYASIARNLARRQGDMLAARAGGGSVNHGHLPFEDIFRIVVQDQTEMIVRWLPDGTRIFVNEAYCRTFGKSYDELVGTSFLPLIEESHRAAVMARINAMTPASPVSTSIHESHLPDGTTCWQEWTDRGFFDERGKLAVLQSVGRDVTATVRVAEALKNSEERFRSAMEHSPIGMAITSIEGRWLEVNPALCRILGYSREELLRIDFQTITHPDDLLHNVSSLASMLARKLSTYSAEKRYIHRRGHTVWTQLNVSLVFHADGSPRYNIAQIQDITERKAAEAQLEQMRHAQRLDTVGRLAGGIAHDFNNLLTVILGQLEIVQLGAARGLDPKPHLESAADAARSAAALTRQLLLFARKQPASPSRIDLNDIVMRTHRMLQRVLGEQVTLELRVDHELPSVWMDQGQLEQVLLNLAVNANDAMPEGGTLTIETHRVFDLPPTIAPGASQPASRAWALLRVADSGAGMTPDVLAHMFEPFFTTKGVGKGTGIGLATVHGVVRGAAGHIEVASSEGQGTRFDIYLPGTEAAAHRGELRDEIPRGRGERVVVVEDQDAVRSTVIGQLTMLGYEVRAFRSADDAIAGLETALAHVDLLLSDVVMGGMDGPAMVEILRRRRPALRVLYMSGYTDDIVLARGVGSELPDVLRKPFSLEALATTLRAAL